MLVMHRLPVARCSMRSSKGQLHKLVRCAAQAQQQSRQGQQQQGQDCSRRTLLLGSGAAALASGIACSASAGDARVGKVQHTDQEWQQLLSPDAYRVLRQAATERPGSSPLLKEKRRGTFVCAGCESDLFASDSKFDAGTGWPSFVSALPGAVDEVPDYSIPFLPRTEVRCATCQGHIGHVFNDGPAPTGLRYCMNGAALAFKPSQEQAS